MNRCFSRWALAPLFVSLLAGAVPAQVPEGWMLISSFNEPHGLQLVSPRSPATAPIPVTNVPTELRRPNGTQTQGANTVAILSDGRVAVGNITGATGLDMAIYVLTLRGTAVQVVRRFLVGKSLGPGAINDLVELPDGSLMFCAENINPNGPLGAHQVGIMNTSTGGIRPIAFTGVPSMVNALELDRQTGTVYLGIWARSTSGEVYRGSLAGGAVTRVVATGAGVTALALRPNGHLLVGAHSGRPRLADVDPSNGQLTQLSFTGFCVGLTRETASGNGVFAHYNVTPNQTVATLVGSTGTLTPAGGNLAGGVGSGIAVQNSPRSYGAPTAAANTYRWQTAPNVGGLPMLGSTTFSLRLIASPNPAAVSALALAAKRGNTRVLGVDVYLDLSSPWATIGIPSTSTTTTVPMPIPNTPALAGIAVHAQSFHIDGGGLAASDAVTFGAIRP